MGLNKNSQQMKVAINEAISGLNNTIIALGKLKQLL